MSWAGLVVLFKPSYLAFMGRGLLITLKIGIFAIAISFVFGTILGVLRFGGQMKTGHRPGDAVRRILAKAAAFYIEAVRNLPALLLILAARFWLRLPGEWAGVAGLALFTSAVIGEIVRGGLNGIDKGQWEAATSQGFTEVQTLGLIIVPQALKRVIPPLTSQFITVVKDTAFVGALAVVELTESGKIIFNREHNPLETFFLIAVVYFILNFSVARVSRALERRLAAQSY